MLVTLIANKVGMFKLTMKSNVVTCMVSPFKINPLTIMRHMVITFCALHIVTSLIM
jgi:hypothetical protein